MCEGREGSKNAVNNHVSKTMVQGGRAMLHYLLNSLGRISCCSRCNSVDYNRFVTVLGGWHGSSCPDNPCGSMTWLDSEGGGSVFVNDD